YGFHNSHNLRGRTLVDKYTDYLLHQFVHIEEIHTKYYKRDDIMQVLKTQITDDTFELDRKYLPVTQAESHFNYYMTTNHIDALLLEDDDARFFVHQAPEVRWDKAKFTALYQWLTGTDGDLYGCARVYGWLLATDTTNFDPTAPPPKTDCWQRM